MRASRLSILCVVILLLGGHYASAQLPPPSNPNLDWFAYYFVNEQFGDDTAEVWPYTNHYLGLPYNASFSEDPNWQPYFDAQLQKATANGKPIYLLVGGCLESWTPGPQCPLVYWDRILDVARNYWHNVAWVEVSHEENISSPQQMEDRINYLRGKLRARGLSDKPFGALFGTGDILTTNAIMAPSLSFVNIEAYLDSDSGDSQTNVNNLNNYLYTAKNRVRNAGKWIFLTGQAYTRGNWTNITTLEALQRPVYYNAYNDNNVIGIQMFAFNRGGGTKFHRELQPAHCEIAVAMGVGSCPGGPQPGTRVALRAANGQWVVAEGGGGGPVYANRWAVGAWETFRLIDLGGGYVALQADNGQYMVAEGGGGQEVNANRSAIGAWETFRLIQLGGGYVALQAANGQYVVAEGGGGGVVNANRDAIGGWETFFLQFVQ